MTVKELIKELEKFDGGELVAFRFNENDNTFFTVEGCVEPRYKKWVYLVHGNVTCYTPTLKKE